MKKVLLALPIVVIAAAAGLYYFVNRESANQVDRLIEQAIATRAYQDISYESVSVGLQGNITISNLHVTDLEGYEYTLREVVVSDYDYLNAVPRNVSVTATGISFPGGMPYQAGGNGALDNYMRSMLAMESIPATFRYRHQYDPEDDYALESSVGFELENAADFSLSSVSRNLPLETLMGINPASAGAETAMINAMAQAEIPEVSLSLADRGIVDTLLTLQSGETGRSVDELRAEARTRLNTLYLYAPAGLQNLTRTVIDELGTFLEGGRTLHVDIRPEYNGSIRQLQPAVFSAMFSGDYASLVELLNLDIRTSDRLPGN